MPDIAFSYFSLNLLTVPKAVDIRNNAKSPEENKNEGHVKKLYRLYHTFMMFQLLLSFRNIT